MHYFPFCDIDKGSPLNEREREPVNHLTHYYDAVHPRYRGEPADPLTRAMWNAAQWTITYKD